MGSWVPIIAVGSSVEVLQGPRGPRIILLGLIALLLIFTIGMICGIENKIMEITAVLINAAYLFVINKLKY